MKPEIVHNVSRLALSIKSPRKNKGLDDLVLDFVVAVPEGTKSLDISKVGKEIGTVLLYKLVQNKRL